MRTYNKRYTGQSFTGESEYHVQGKRETFTYGPDSDHTRTREVQQWYGPGFDMVYWDDCTAYVVMPHESAVLASHYGRGRIVGIAE